MTENFVTSNKGTMPGPAGSGRNETGHNIPDNGKIHTATAPRPVERATALREQSIARPHEPRSTLRRRTQMDICGKDPEIPYVKFEAAVRDPVCSLMERQDRMNEEIFYRINDLRYRVEDLEQDRPAAGDMP